jgi:hypothetical protein
MVGGTSQREILLIIKHQMKIIKITLFILLLVGCNKTNNVLIVTAKSNSVDCHMCPGFIIIEKGIQKDTLKMGSWGSPPNFNQFKANGGDYIAFESSYFSGGINESSLSILSLNEDSYLTPVFDTLISDEQINSLKTTRRILEFRMPDTLLVHNYNETYNSFNENQIRTDSLTELLLIKNSALFSGINEIKVSNLIMPNAGKSVPGALIVSNGIKTDTIYDCSYGRFPDYKRVISGGTDYLLTTCDINGAGNNMRNYFIWSLKNETFMDTLFYKQIYTGEISHVEDAWPYMDKWTQREVSFSINDEKVVFKTDSIITLVDNDSNEVIDTISIGQKTLKYDLKKR